MIHTSSHIVSRFAPSPTGRMHLGNIFTALISWLVARKNGGRWLLRIEDLDPQRSRLEYAKIIEDDLNWLGLDWDEGGIEGKGDNGPYLQSLRQDFYEAALSSLQSAGYTYPCYCTRADIAATQAPHASDGRVIYPGTCRPGNVESCGNPQRSPSVRLLMPECCVEFEDMIAGKLHADMAVEWGDIVLRRADGAWAYQLAVVVDDAAMRVTDVVRGCDLLGSCAPQSLIAQLLGLPVPRYLHVPLICNAAGVRLSKRDRALAMDSLRAKYSSREIIGQLAAIAGLVDSPVSLSPGELGDIFEVSLLPKKEKILLGK